MTAAQHGGAKGWEEDSETKTKLYVGGKDKKAIPTRRKEWSWESGQRSRDNKGYRKKDELPARKNCLQVPDVQR